VSRLVIRGRRIDGGRDVCPAAASGADTGKVTVVHAVPDLTVDVYANGGLLLEDFVPTNDMSTIKEPRARVTVRHTAAAPAVDVRFKRPGGKWKMVMSLKPKTHYFVYAWGSAEDGSLALNLSTRRLWHC
jgi:hypothetical protein